jgi:hypothetical protein
LTGINGTSPSTSQALVVFGLVVVIVVVVIIVIRKLLTFTLAVLEYPFRRHNFDIIPIA